MIAIEIKHNVIEKFTHKNKIRKVEIKKVLIF
jgi:hypothetical protein